MVSNRLHQLPHHAVIGSVEPATLTGCRVLADDVLRSVTVAKHEMPTLVHHDVPTLLQGKSGNEGRIVVAAPLPIDCHRPDTRTLDQHQAVNVGGQVWEPLKCHESVVNHPLTHRHPGNVGVDRCCSHVVSPGAMNLILVSAERTRSMSSSSAVLKANCSP